MNRAEIANELAEQLVLDGKGQVGPVLAEFVPDDSFEAPWEVMDIPGLMLVAIYERGWFDAYNGRSDRPASALCDELYDVLSGLGPKEVLGNMGMFARHLGEEFEGDAVDAFEYSDTKEEAADEITGKVCDSLRDMTFDDAVDAFAAIMHELGHECYVFSHNGYNQGEHVITVFKAVDAEGNPVPKKEAQAMSETIAAWAFGDVYGLVVTYDHDIASVWGFYGAPDEDTVREHVVELLGELDADEIELDEAA